MSRKQKIIRDRVAMLKLGLQKAGYLTGDENESEKTVEAYKELALNMVADLLHLGAAEYGLDLTDDDRKAIELLEGVSKGAYYSFIRETQGRID